RRAALPRKEPPAWPDPAGPEPRPACPPGLLTGGAAALPFLAGRALWEAPSTVAAIAGSTWDHASHGGPSVDSGTTAAERRVCGRPSGRQRHKKVIPG